MYLDNRRRFVSGIMLALILAFGIVAIAIAVNRPSPTHRSLATELGAAYKDGGTGVLLRINGIDISHAEFAAGKSAYDNLLWSLRDLTARAVPEGHWTPTPIHDRYRGDLPHYVVDPYRPLLFLLEEHGRETVALADLMLEYARFSKAVESGHLPSVLEVTEYVQRVRDSHEAEISAAQGAEWGIVAVTAGYIDGMGAGTYWTEFYFRQATRKMADGSWVDASTAEYGKEAVKGTLDIDGHLDRLAILDVDVEIVDPSEIDATAETAIRYLEGLWGLPDQASSSELDSTLE